MNSTVQKWGNSLAVRIPKPFAEESRLTTGAVIELVMVDGEIVIRPPKKRRQNLEAMLKQVTRKNIHTEEEFGGPEGREIL
jgi:antitoxin MazE